MKSIFNLSAITIFSSLFIGLFSNPNSSNDVLTDVDIYQLIDQDLEEEYPQIANVDMVTNSITENQYLTADFDVEIENTPWYNDDDEIIGVNISGTGSGVDQNLNEVTTAFITKINFETGKKWGSQIILAPGNYSVKYRHASRMDQDLYCSTDIKIDDAIFAGMNSIETRGKLEGQGSSAIRYDNYNTTVSNYTQLLSHQQIDGTISVHAYIN